MKKAISALSTGLSVVALGAAIAYAQTFTMPPPAGVVVIGCTYNSAPPTLISGQITYAQCDSTGHIATGGGGGGGAATIADGADIAEGATAATAWPGTGSGSVVAIGKATWAKLDQLLTAMSNPTPAGTNVIGGVISGGTTIMVCASPTTTNATYAANTNIGGLITLANLWGARGSGIIQSVRVDFKTVQTVGFDLYVFNDNPSASTWTDNAANAINVADVFKVAAPISMTNNKSGLGTHTVYSAVGIGQAIDMVSNNTSGYFILSPTGTTASMGSTSGAQLCVTVLRDDPS